MSDIHASAQTEKQRGYVRPNKCGVGGHFPGAYEYRVLRQNSSGGWHTVLYTEFLDRALDVAGDDDVVETCSWQRVTTC